METTNSHSAIEKIGESIKRSITLKLLSIFILMLLLMIPMAYVQDLIHERQQLRQEAINEVSSVWSEKQVVYGPILSVPVTREVMSNNVIKLVRDWAHFLPSDLTVSGEVNPQMLNRGIYEVIVYNSNLTFSGNFNGIQKYFDQLEEYEIHWDDAVLTVNISDLRGIQEKIEIQWNKVQRTFDPGSKFPELAPSGVTVSDLADSSASLEMSNFSFNIDLQGSEYLGFLPLGKVTNVKLVSDWPDPSFAGAFLPDMREVSEEGFTAEYKILELNRNYPQFWVGNSHSSNMLGSSFGVDLILPSNDYQKSIRSAKYALLAISLTFLSFFLIEIFNKKKMHPFQYILIGLALCLFYTLLVSISEHSNFNIAYLISSVAIISIIGFYALAILRNIKQTLVLVVVLCFTYSFVFVTLQLQDFALLIGSIGLTLILATTMYLTRHINWYEISSIQKDPAH